MMENSTKISVTANDASYTIPSGQPLEEFLSDLGFAPDLVVVERNRQALSPGEKAGIRLEDGDRLEIVRIVAGG